MNNLDVLIHGVAGLVHVLPLHCKNVCWRVNASIFAPS